MIIYNIVFWNEGYTSAGESDVTEKIFLEITEFGNGSIWLRIFFNNLGVLF